MTERRSSPRFTAARRRMLFRILGPGGETLAYGALEDTCPGGARLVTARPCPGGPAMLVPLPPHPLAGQQFPFRIARSGPLAGGGAFLAGPFDPPVSDAEARALAEAT